ncbi:MAG: hypothetical protein VX974_14585 [Pseudomonadota bacterium]|nr:hypothetical protein [Pseudomonadota bacterium]
MNKIKKIYRELRVSRNEPPLLYLLLNGYPPKAKRKEGTQGLKAVVIDPLKSKTCFDLIHSPLIMNGGGWFATIVYCRSFDGIFERIQSPDLLPDWK